MDVIVFDSFKITGFGIIASLKVGTRSTLSGSIIMSQESGREWLVESKIIETTDLDISTLDDDESIVYSHLNFRTWENRENVIESIKIRNENGIFQFKLQGINHDDKPIKGESLTIK